MTRRSDCDVVVVEASFPPPYNAPHIVPTKDGVMIAMPPDYPREIVAMVAQHACPESQQPAIRRALGLPAPVSAVQAARSALKGLN